MVLGANGQFARNTTHLLLRDTDAKLTLYLRHASRLKKPDPQRVTIVEGDVLDEETLEKAMGGQDVVYAIGRLAQDDLTSVSVQSAPRQLRYERRCRPADEVALFSLSLIREKCLVEGLVPAKMIPTFHDS